MWECPKCTARASNPEQLSKHVRACTKPMQPQVKGWQGDTIPVAGLLNEPTAHSPNRTPPGEVLYGWRDWKPR